MHHQGVLSPWLHALFSFPMHHQAVPFTLVHVSLLGFSIPVLTQCITVYYFLVSCVFACAFYKSHFGALVLLFLFLSLPFFTTNLWGLSEFGMTGFGEQRQSIRKRYHTMVLLYLFTIVVFYLFFSFDFLS